MSFIPLPTIPPPPSSLLPSLHPTTNPVPSNTAHSQTHARRVKSVPTHSTSSLALLALDERAITQRKLAIAMYGWSWLRPAGCAKTMLGRKEEEVEREEVERQLREVEMQERVQAELEEGERLRGIQEAGGDAAGLEERDLDDEVPEADEEEPVGDDDEEEDMMGDLDDEIPEAVGDETGFTYDSRREPDSEDEGDPNGEGETGITDEVERSHLHSRGNSTSMPPSARRQMMAMGYDEEAMAIANAMLEEDEMDMMGGERDLDDEVPDADMDIDVDEEGWEHTDTELEMLEEESEMDISVLQQPRARNERIGTPMTVDSSVVGSTSGRGGGGRRSWLGAASARRNLFGRVNSEGVVGGGGSGSIFGRTPESLRFEGGGDASAEEGQNRRRSSRRVSGMGLGTRGPGGGQRENRESLD